MRSIFGSRETKVRAESSRAIVKQRAKCEFRARTVYPWYLSSWDANWSVRRTNARAIRIAGRSLIPHGRARARNTYTIMLSLYISCIYVRTVLCVYWHIRNWRAFLIVNESVAGPLENCPFEPLLAVTATVLPSPRVTNPSISRVKRKKTRWKCTFAATIAEIQNRSFRLRGADSPRAMNFREYRPGISLSRNSRRAYANPRPFCALRAQVINRIANSSLIPRLSRFDCRVIIASTPIGIVRRLYALLSFCRAYMYVRDK